MTNNPFKYASLFRQVIEALAGTVCLLNLGKPAYRRIVSEEGDTPAAANGKEEVVLNPLIPNGNIIFTDNQTRLGVARNVKISQFIASWDDINFSNNQSDVLESINDVFRVNSLVIAATVRAIGNRLKEPIQKGEDEVVLY